MKSVYTVRKEFEVYSQPWKTKFSMFFNVIKPRIDKITRNIFFASILIYPNSVVSSVTKPNNRQATLKSSEKSNSVASGSKQNEQTEWTVACDWKGSQFSTK